MFCRLNEVRRNVCVIRIFPLQSYNVFILSTLSQKQNSKNIRHSDANINVSSNFMRATHQILAVVVMLFALACNKGLSKKTEVQRIVVAKGICYECPIQAIDISKSLSMNYMKISAHGGGAFFYKSRIDSLQWIKLVEYISKLNWKAATNCSCNVNEPAVELVIFYDSINSKSVVGQICCLPDSIMKFTSWVLTIPEHVKLEMTEGPIKIPTTANRLPPVVPIREDFKFTEPEH